MDWGESGQVDELESGFSELGLERSITSGLKVSSQKLILNSVAKIIKNVMWE